MKRIILTISFLVISNIFMTLAWYGHLKLKEMNKLAGVSLMVIILLSWGVAFFEYIFLVPANRIGFSLNGGPFSLWQLKLLQEVITLVVFTGFMLIFFKNESFRWNHLVGFVLLIFAVFFMFKK